MKGRRTKCHVEEPCPGERPRQESEAKKIKTFARQSDLTSILENLKRFARAQMNLPGLRPQNERGEHIHELVCM